MTHRRGVTPHIQALLFVAVPLVGCGDYAPDEKTSEVMEGPSATPGTPSAPDPSSSATAPGPSATGPGAPPSMPEPAATPSGPPEPAAAPASCDMASAPCGGDLAGTWSVMDCPHELTGVVNMLGFGLGCTEAAITSGSLQVSGTITFNADGTFTDATVTTGEQVVELEPTCLNISGTVTQCDRVGGPVQGSLGYEMFNCIPNDATMGCTCTATINQEGGIALVSPEAETEGHHMSVDTTTVSLGEEQNYSYCASPSALVMTFPTPGKIGTVTGPIVLQKQ